MFGFSEPDYEKIVLKHRLTELENRLTNLERESLFRRGLSIVTVRMGSSRDNRSWNKLLLMADEYGYEYYNSVDCIFGTEVRFKKKMESERQ